MRKPRTPQEPIESPANQQTAVPPAPPTSPTASRAEDTTTNILGRDLNYAVGNPRGLLDLLNTTFNNADQHIPQLKQIAAMAGIDIGGIPPNTAIDYFPREILIATASQQKMGNFLRQLLLSDNESSFVEFVTSLLLDDDDIGVKGVLIASFNELEPGGVYDAAASDYAELRGRYGLGE